MCGRSLIRASIWDRMNESVILMSFSFHSFSFPFPSSQKQQAIPWMDDYHQHYYLKWAIANFLSLVSALSSFFLFRSHSLAHGVRWAVWGDYLEIVYIKWMINICAVSLRWVGYVLLLIHEIAMMKQFTVGKLIFFFQIPRDGLSDGFWKWFWFPTSSQLSPSLFLPLPKFWKICLFSNWIHAQTMPRHHHWCLTVVNDPRAINTSKA